MGATVDLDQLADVAVRLAEASGPEIRARFRRPTRVEQKSNRTPVTEADRAAEAAMRRVLSELRPEDGIIGEEFGADRPDAPIVWVLDPIDGTKAFMTGRPTFGTLIAALIDGTPAVGVIDQPIVGDRWIGATGRPTRHNGTPARTRACPRLNAAILSSTGPELFDDGPDAIGFEHLRHNVDFVTWGGDCYAYGLLSSGYLDIVVEAGLALHDFSALAPVVNGAGGSMTDWQGEPLRQGSDGHVLAVGDPAMAGTVRALLNADR